MKVRLGCSLWNVARADPGQEARRLSYAGVRLFHWDRTDGSFAPSGGYTAENASFITTNLALRAEAHLMMTDPRPEIDQWCEFCELVIVPIEIDVCHDAIRRIEKRGVQAGVAISPMTPLPSLTEIHGLPVLCMSVPPGRAGSSFLPTTYARVRALRHLFYCGVDGGITADCIAPLREAGASWIVVGTDLLNAPDPRAWLESAGVGVP